MAMRKATITFIALNILFCYAFLLILAQEKRMEEEDDNGQKIKSI